MQDTFQDSIAPAFDIENNFDFLDDCDQYSEPDSSSKSLDKSESNSSPNQSEKSGTKDSCKDA